MTKEEYIDTNEYGYDADKGIWSKHYNRFLKGYYWYFKEEWEKLIYEQRETNCIAERNR